MEHVIITGVIKDLPTRIFVTVRAFHFSFSCFRNTYNDNYRDVRYLVSLVAP
ncbi:hypothetical protein LCGC14_1076280 [marine sediment metagenome]|uniref:Uncharacterized protein n=1 Tax=marine sediment metagenome TaxID=412755 RepID=A0A0F9MLG5_9ZZZZ